MRDVDGVTSCKKNDAKPKINKNINKNKWNIIKKITEKKLIKKSLDSIVIWYVKIYNEIFL